MTYENCLKLSEHFSKMGNKEQAKFYKERAERKNPNPKPSTKSKEVENGKKPER